MEPPVVLSKNALKRKLKQEKWLKAKEEKKLRMTEEKRIKAEARAAESQNLPEISEEEKQANSARRAAVTEARLNAFKSLCENGYKVCIDCSFDDVMTRERDLASLQQQLMYSYSANRRSTKPLNLHFSGLSPAFTERLGKIAGFATWKDKGLNMTSESYTSLAPTKPAEQDPPSIVYLTADSENVLEHLDPSTVYVIGGIVDHNTHKGLTLRKAESAGVATARLPLAEHVDMGAFSRVFTVNHMIDLLLRYGELDSDWRQAMLLALPARKKEKKKKAKGGGKGGAGESKGSSQEEAAAKGCGGAVENPKEESDQEGEE